jgi:hypothetical protein
MWSVVHFDTRYANSQEGGCPPSAGALIAIASSSRSSSGVTRSVVEAASLALAIPEPVKAIAERPGIHSLFQAGFQPDNRSSGE